MGIFPLAVNGGAGDEFQAALARAVIGGLAMSTLIALAVIPAIYTGVHDLLRRLKAWPRLHDEVGRGPTDGLTFGRMSAVPSR